MGEFQIKNGFGSKKPPTQREKVWQQDPTQITPCLPQTTYCMSQTGRGFFITEGVNGNIDCRQPINEQDGHRQVIWNYYIAPLSNITCHQKTVNTPTTHMKLLYRTHVISRVTRKREHPSPHTHIHETVGSHPCDILWHQGKGPPPPHIQKILQDRTTVISYNIKNGKKSHIQKIVIFDIFKKNSRLSLSSENQWRCNHVKRLFLIRTIYWHHLKRFRPLHR